MSSQHSSTVASVATALKVLMLLHCEAGVRHRALLRTYYITQYMLLKWQQ